MPHNQYRKRLDALFSDVERLAADPDCASPRLRQEMEALMARLCELEAHVAEHENQPVPEPVAPVIPAALMERLHKLETLVAEHENQPSPELVAPAVPPVEPNVRAVMPPMLYEKEQVGYTFSEEAIHNLQDSAPSANPGKSIVAPLTASGQTIGTLDAQIEPSSGRAWTPEETGLLEAVAQQASQQIQNLRLLTATERARADAEAATRRFMHENWDAYLDAIHHSERVGYAYDQTSVVPYDISSQHDEGVRETVNVMEEQVGTLFVKSDPANPLTEQEKDMIAAIAHQVAQQVENIRLLADASRARSEAEEASRRLTRENWDAYTTQKGESDPGFMYDSNRVTSTKNTPMPQAMDFSQPFRVRGEVIGQLAVAGMKNMTPEDTELAVAIAERASVHLETLRLGEELQKRAAELQTVATLSATTSTVLNPDELLQEVVDLAKERFNLYHAHVYLANEAWNTLLLASGAGQTGRQMVADTHAIPMDDENSLIARAARERVGLIINDVRNHPGYKPHPSLPGVRAEMAIPMIVANKVLGILDVQSEKVGRFTEEDKNIQTTLATQIAIALQNARLYVEQSATLIQLRELDRLKSSFLANMSHELRTPLNSILGFADVILEELDGPLTPNMDNDLKLIQKNGQHLLHLINDVLDMAKIESGRMNLHPEKFTVQDLLEEVTSLTSSVASAKNLSLFIEPTSDHLVVVEADRTRLRQVMINLVGNATKFTERGKIALSAEQRGDRVLIAVRDTGIGIPPDKLEAVFQEFTQVDTSTTRKVGGTGLGLPISRKLIDMHGGRLWAESTGVNGEGSTFFVELPIEAHLTEPIEKLEK